MSKDSPSDYLIDTAMTAVNGNGTAGGALLKLVLPRVLDLLQGEWSEDARLQIQGHIDRGLRELGLI